MLTNLKHLENGSLGSDLQICFSAPALSPSALLPAGGALGEKRKRLSISLTEECGKNARKLEMLLPSERQEDAYIVHARQ